MEAPRPGAVLPTEMAALICPDWRMPSLVIAAPGGEVAYANTPCLQMLAARDTIEIVDGRLSFLAPQITEKFFSLLERMLANGLEEATLIERDRGGGIVISALIRNMQGFFRDVVARHAGGSDSTRFAVIELASSRDRLAWPAMRAFAQAFDLSTPEAEIAELMTQGLSDEEMSVTNKRSLTDVRSLQRSLFRKTNCRHAAQFVRLVMTLCPPARSA